MKSFLKRAAIPFLFVITSLTSDIKAQWVTIPDANFVTYLQQNFPTCMNGSLMDTTCSAIINASIVDCNTLNIQNLDGIQYFDSLDQLICKYNSLTSLPALPATLILLNCNNNQLTALPTLPSTLLSLHFDNNFISALPLLPLGLTELYCWHNQLSNLPSPLPPALYDLICADNLLSNLPSLPQTLFTLTCSGNQLTSLPPLPPNLQGFGCQFNQLTSLPPIPSTVANFICNNNQLTSIPTLPAYLNSFICNNNQITCLPTMPNTFNPNYFDISNNPITCLPNYVAAMDSTTLAIPLCSGNDLINNPNACAGFKGIIGNTFSDANNNCGFDVADGFVKNIPVHVFDTSGILVSTFYSLNNGTYNFSLDSGVYTVQLDTLHKPYTSICTYPGIDSTVTLTTANPMASKINFDITCKPGFDVGIKSIHSTGLVFPSMMHKLSVAAGDLNRWYDLHCPANISGTVVITVNGPVIFSGIPAGALTPANINGNIFTYSITDFTTTDPNGFDLLFTTDTSAQAGDPICVTVDVTPIIGDNDTINNHYSFCYQVVNSYDPNAKEVYPTTVNPGFADYFTYTVHFQNVGTAPAQNIRVVDTLAGNLDFNTFEIINYSHANTSTLTGNVATFRFPNIQLADSASNPEGSKGFIQYRIKPIANLPFGTQIENKADIYFDFNTPITTNTAVSTFNSTVGLSPNPSPQERRVMVYPNPGKGIFNLSFYDNYSSTKTIEVFNLIGEKIFSTIVKTANTIVDLSREATGVYVLRVNDATNVFTYRLVKQ